MRADFLRTALQTLLQHEDTPNWIRAYIEAVLKAEKEVYDDRPEQTSSDPP